MSNYFIQRPLTRLQSQLKKHIEENYLHIKPLQRTIFKAEKDNELKYLCKETFTISGCYYEPRKMNLLMILCNSAKDENIDLIKKIIPYTDIYINQENEMDKTHKDVLTTITGYYNFDTIIYFISKVYKIEDIINGNNILYDCYFGNQKLSIEDKINITKYISEKSGVEVRDIFVNSERILNFLAHYHCGIWTKNNNLIKFLIEQGCDINYNYGEALKGFLSSYIHTDELVKEYELIKMFIENGYNVERNGLVNYYIESKYSYKPTLLMLLNFKSNNFNTIYLTKECNICYKTYNNISECNDDNDDKIKQLAINPCGHTVCNKCITEINSCPICRCDINNTVEINNDQDK